MGAASPRRGYGLLLLPGVAEAADFGQERVAFLLGSETGSAFQVTLVPRRVPLDFGG